MQFDDLYKLIFENSLEDIDSEYQKLAQSPKEKKTRYKKISKSSLNSYHYARDVLKGKDVPDIILQNIAYSSDYSYRYARDILKGEDVPDIILQSIANNPDYADRSLT